MVTTGDPPCLKARILQVILGTQPMKMRILTTKHLDATSKHDGLRPQKLRVDEQKRDFFYSN